MGGCTGFALEIDNDVGAVVVGFDRHFNYYKIQYAQLAINEHGVSGSLLSGLEAVCLCLLSRTRFLDLW